MAGLKPGKTIEQSSTSIASGRVIDSSPAAGASVPVGSNVTLIVSTGPPSVQVPDVTTEDVGQAKATLQSRGFNVDDQRRGDDHRHAGHRAQPEPVRRASPPPAARP